MTHNAPINSIDKTEDWAIHCIKTFLGGATSITYNDYGSSVRLSELYKAYNGDLPLEVFKTTVNPFNAHGQLSRFPAEIREFNIIKPLVDKLLGEYLDRPRNFMVTVVNSDVESKYKKAEQQKYTDYFNKLVENNIAKLNNQEEPYQKIPDVNQIKEELKNWNDERAIAGQQALNLLISEIEYETKLPVLFKHFIIAGYAVTHRDIFNNTIHWKPKNPIKFWYKGNEESLFIEDSEVQVYRTNQSLNQIISHFGEELTEEELEMLQSKTGYGASLPALIEDGIRRTSDMYYEPGRIDSKGFNDSLDEVIEVAHVVWRTVCKKGRITTINEDGFEEYIFVDDTYKPSVLEEIEWGFYPELWEGYSLGGCIYKSIQRLPVVVEAIDNPTNIKSCYNGIVYSNLNTINKSIVEMAMPYQVSYSILKYNLELTLAKNIGTVLALPIDLIPNTDGWDVEKMLYYMKSTGFLFVNNNDGGNKISAIAADLLNYVEKQYEICELIKTELMELFGFNKPRLGQQSAQTGLGLSKEMTYTSTLMSEHIFKAFDDFIVKDLNVLLHYTKFAWRNGKKGMMNISDTERIRYSINPQDYSDVSLGVTVVNSAREKEALNKIKNVVEAMANNGASPELLVEVSKANNIASLQEKLKEYTKNQREYEEQQNQAAAEAAQKVVDTQSQQSQAKIESDEKIAFARMETDLAIARANLNTNVAEPNALPEVNNDSNINELELLKAHLDAEQKKIDNALKNKDLDIKSKAEDNKLKIAQENKNKYDK